ncbi:hypothetical protein [Modestobacter lapidis]|nr:hypothetical protein [Modestobacter lapidis]
MRGAAGALVAAGLVATGCSGGAAPSAGTPTATVSALPAVPGIEAEAVRLRTDEAVGGQLQVRVTDTGTTPFTVTAVAIDSPGFAPLPAEPVSATFDPGRTIDLPTPFGPARCAAGPEPAAARLTVVRADGAVAELRVPLTGGTLTQLHAEECALAAVREVVGIALADLAPAPGGTRLTGAVVLSRRAGGEPIAVTALARSVLLDAVPDEELPATLGPDADRLRLPVTFEPATCEPHVLAEAKKPFVFPLTVVVGGSDGVAVDLPVDGGQRALLQDLVDRVCG